MTPLQSNSFYTQQMIGTMERIRQVCLLTPSVARYAHDGKRICSAPSPPHIRGSKLYTQYKHPFSLGLLSPQNRQLIDGQCHEKIYTPGPLQSEETTTHFRAEKGTLPNTNATTCRYFSQIYLGRGGRPDETCLLSN